MEWALLVAAAYLVGSLPFGYWACLTRGIDIRTVGSGNVGTTNVWRCAGPKLGMLVFLLDVGKGAAPTYAGLALGGPKWGVIAGTAAIVGHSASPFLGFRGGKGVATTLGMLIAATPVTASLVFGFWLLLTLTTRYVSVASISACLFAIATAFARGENPWIQGVFLLLAALIIVRHKSNIGRLLRGEEPKFSFSKRPAPAPDAAAAEEEEPVGV